MTSPLTYPQIARLVRTSPYAAPRTYATVDMPGEIVNEWLAITANVELDDKGHLRLDDGFVIVHRPTGLATLNGCLACCRHLATEMVKLGIDWNTGDTQPSDFSTGKVKFMDGLLADQRDALMSLWRQRINCTAGVSCDLHKPDPYGFDDYADDEIVVRHESVTA